MPQPDRGDGPWGDAVQHWLDTLKMRQADVARATGIEPKTISSIARGFDTTTRKLRKIAEAFNDVARRRHLPTTIAIEDVLVSPNRTSAVEARRQMIQEITERVTRDMEARLARYVAPTPAAEESIDTHFARAVLKDEAQQQTPADRTVTRVRARKPVRRLGQKK